MSPMMTRKILRLLPATSDINQLRFSTNTRSIDLLATIICCRLQTATFKTISVAKKRRTKTIHSHLKQQAAVVSCSANFEKYSATCAIINRQYIFIKDGKPTRNNTVQRYRCRNKDSRQFIKCRAVLEITVGDAPAINRVDREHTHPPEIGRLEKMQQRFD